MKKLAAKYQALDSSLPWRVRRGCRSLLAQATHGAWRTLASFAVGLVFATFALAGERSGAEPSQLMATSSASGVPQVLASSQESSPSQKNVTPKNTAPQSAASKKPTRASASQDDDDLAPEFEPPIMAGAMISIESFDPKLETFSIIIIGEEGVGPNIAMPGDLADAVTTIDRKELEAHPERVVGNSYKLDKDLRLLSLLGEKKRLELLKRKKKKKN